METVKKYLKSTESRNFLIYTCASLIAGISWFLVIILLTRKLSIAEFGQMELITTYATFLSVLFTFGPSSLLMIDYHQLQRDEYSAMLRDIIMLVFALSGGGMLIILILTLVFKTQIFSGPVSTAAIVFGFAAYFLNLFLLLFYQVFVISAKAWHHSLVRIVTTLGLLVLSFAALEWLTLGLWGYFLAFTIINFIGLLICGVFSREYFAGFSAKLSAARAKKYLKDGFPFLVSGITYVLMMSIDRWIILYFTDDYTVGIYAAAMRFGQGYENIIIIPFLNVYTAMIFKQFSGGNYRQKYNIIIPAVLFLFGLLAIITPPIARLLIPGSYELSFTLIPYIVTGFGVYFLSLFPMAVLNYKKSTAIILFISLSILALHIILNFILVSSYGLFGASYAFIGSNLVKIVALVLILLYYFKKND